LGEANEPKPRANPDHDNTVVWETLVGEVFLKQL